MSGLPEENPNELEPRELSLRGLSEAFAEALARQRAADEPPEGQGGLEERVTVAAVETGEAPAEPSAVLPEQPASAEQTDSDADDACPVSPRTILEAMLFVGDPENRPLECGRAAELMRGVEPEDVPALVEELNESYRLGGCPYRIRSDGAGYRLMLGEKFDRVREKFYGRIRLARLSQAAIDVLAIVAYRQPLGADEVSRLRDKPSHHILSQLVRRRLLRVERPAEGPRRPLYRTTDRFLELFDLKSLADLPESEEFHRP